MIAMKQPGLALHSHDVPGYKYQMWATWTVPKTMNADGVVSWILHAESCVQDEFLHNVILNCHGEPGYLYMGAGIGINDVRAFERLRGKEVGRIWIVACDVHKEATYLGGQGHDFCVALARASGCTVMAADTTQYVYESSLPYGFIDDYEGNLYAYDGSGAVTTPY